MTHFHRHLAKTLYSSRPSYLQLLHEFSALGPYLRREQCEPDRFFFDSRFVTSMPRRAGWGWWLLLEPCAGGFTGQSELAGHTATGIWLNRAVPSALWPELESSREQFLESVAMLCQQWQLELVSIRRRESERLVGV
ncbi:MAG: Crl family RNA polymerase assembly factor [Aeromonadaceae bacterium]